MKKIIKIIVFLVVVLLALIPLLINPVFEWQRSKWSKENFTSYSEGEAIEFTDIIWKSDLVGQDTVEKVAFYVQSDLDGVNIDNLYFQFDTGSRSTLLYGNSIKAVESDEVQFQYNVDSTYAYNVKFNIGNMFLESDSIRILKDYGMSNYDSTFTRIGTIGYDAIYGRTLIMDFKNDKIALTELDAHELKREVTYHDDVSIEKFPPFVNAQLDKKKIKLFYDTGSSMFPIVTNPKN